MAAPSTPMHTKRASIYVSDASIILAQRTPMASPTKSHDSLLALSSEASDVIDHYTILELGPQASTEQVKAAYRRLRVVYFSSNAQKYRALQAAFDTLMDPEARQVYDLNYQAPSLSGTGEIIDPSKHSRADSHHGDDMAILEEDEDMEAARSQDPNWGLKRHQRPQEPLIGSEPYPSYLPLPTHFLSKCNRPAYIGQFARTALPN
ncbi:hypothetical protein EJ02DRAFT_459922 [Clathrospora elynae]|uniref:J domain-containing protein n=1 Tax=Clathrospora elynae TaxID=706981 RepID=A0A6A5SEW4_9PLEO|nr:hypothetical protein EJ02DRAFT_459922 [Clathrospora elynae]